MTSDVTISILDHGRRPRGGRQGKQACGEIIGALRASHRVTLDFTDVESVGATFLDEMLGALVARHGSAILRRVVFRGCSTDVETSIVRALRSMAPIEGPLQFSAAPSQRR